MLFHTFNFFIFYTIFITAYFVLKSQKHRVLCILLFSNIFYAWWNWKLLGLIWLTIVLDFIISKKIHGTENQRKKLFYLFITLFINFGLLGFFKYWNFFMSSAAMFGLGKANSFLIQNLILPVGISFYTFQSISYTIDIYRNKYKPIDNLIDYASFVSFFPQLVAGPIERVDFLLPQIKEKTNFSIANFNEALWLFSQGLFRKGLGDAFAELADPTFKTISTSSEANIFYSILYFTFQIYLDFSGYTLMARGIAKSIGINLSLNFQSPYFSFSLREFWTRWHISLSSWLREYLYFSLGGSKTSKIFTYRNLLITMILGGLWHGAGANFLIWGFLHGLYLCINHFWIGWIKYPKRFFLYHFNFSIINILSPIQRKAMSWLLTFMVVSYTWLYFRISDFSDAKLANKAILKFFANPSYDPQMGRMLLLLLPIFLVDFIEMKNKYNVNFAEFSIWKNILFGIFTAFFFILGLIFVVGKPTSQFIYFQF